MKEPFYYLRPNKYVDRQLFTDILLGLSSELNISLYKYIGFGSYQFDDFKLLHNRLKINDMLSLENNRTTFKRANFNLPYRCIKIQQQSSTDFISNFICEDRNYIFWLDYTDPSELGQQFSDCATLLDKLNRHDIVKITLNANAASLSDNKISPSELQLKRLEELHSRLGENVPADITPMDMTTKNYPRTLLRCLEKLIKETLHATTFDKRYFFPLLSTVYRDGQSMLTLLGIILDDKQDEERIKKSLACLDYVSLSWKSVLIDIPTLSIKEIIEINKRLPKKSASKLLKSKYPFIFTEDEQAESYISYYKYYPNFHHFNL